MSFIFKGINSRDMGIYHTTPSIPYIAPKRSSVQEVQGKDGQYVFEDGYNNSIVSLECIIVGGKVLNRRKQARAIAAWLANIGTLIFDYEKDIAYNVIKVTNDIDAAMVKATDEFTITFEVEPYQEQVFYNDSLTWGEANVAWGYANIPWGGYDRVFTVSAGETIDVENAGTYKALPIIVLTGTAASVDIGDFIFNNLAGIVYIDCKNNLVYEISGDSKINRISDFTGTFPELNPGTNQFTISGTITTLEIEFDYKNTYL